jgi:hypothetical protein
MKNHIALNTLIKKKSQLVLLQNQNIITEKN